MKRFTLFSIVAFALYACAQTLPSTGNFGEKITEDGALSTQEFVTKMGDKESMEGKITGTVQKVCQAEGCWYTLALENGNTIRVITRDHDFKLPKDASGKVAIAEGEAKVITTSVERLKHLAEDAGKSPEEIDQITEPKEELEFTAKGVIIKEAE